MAELLIEEAIPGTPLDIEGSFNVRDFGGYAAEDGRVIKPRRFVRTGSLFGVSEQGKQALLDMGVRRIIDLRSKQEVQDKPDAMMDDARFVWANVPMLDYIHSRIAAQQLDGLPTSLEEMYIGLLERGKDDFRRIFELFAGPEQEGIVFHCTAGKDRTGITAMLLLSLAGLDRQTIIQDYARSEQELRPLLMKYPLNIPEHFTQSRPETMQATLDYLQNRYGGARAYLSDIGVTPEQQNAILAKLFD